MHTTPHYEHDEERKKVLHCLMHDSYTYYQLYIDMLIINMTVFIKSLITQNESGRDIMPVKNILLPIIIIQGYSD